MLFVSEGGKKCKQAFEAFYRLLDGKANPIHFSLFLLTDLTVTVGCGWIFQIPIQPPAAPRDGRKQLCAVCT